MREENQLNIICRIIERYQLIKQGAESREFGENRPEQMVSGLRTDLLRTANMPLSRHLKDFFKAHPQMGSRDRRLASAFVYNYFRIGKVLNDLRMVERLTIANFLCSGESNPILDYCIKKFSLLTEEDIALPIEEKIAKIKGQYPSFNPEQIFPFINHLSKNVNQQKFIGSFLRQPKLWIRIRRGFEETVKQELRTKNFFFEVDENNKSAVSLLNTTSLEKTESFINGYFEIQDWSSQQTLGYMEPKPNECWWDACAGSGGKSLMIADAEPTVSTLATDSRPSILKNLEERFHKAGVKHYKIEVLDLSTVHRRPLSVNELQSEITNPKFAILADVPCTGSGTWARTPEWLTMFSDDSLERFVVLQRNIIRNLAGTMMPGTPLVYITCSVFKEENEENVEWILANTRLSLQKSGYIEGVDRHADTMFAARFIAQ